MARLLKPEVSLAVAAGTGAVVYGIYSQATPTIADIRAGDVGSPDIDAAERTATWTAAVVVSGISLIAKDPTIFVVGGAMIVAMAWWTRHANTVNPLTGFARDVEGAQIIEMPSNESGEELAGEY